MSICSRGGRRPTPITAAAPSSCSTPKSCERVRRSLRLFDGRSERIRVYGRCKAKIMRRADGTLFVDSFAHGGIQYELKWDFAAAKAALEREDEAGIASRRFR